jgi:hypothetical protein
LARRKDFIVRLERDLTAERGGKYGKKSISGRFIHFVEFGRYIDGFSSGLCGMS